MELIEITIEEKLTDIKLGSMRYVFDIITDLSDRVTKLEEAAKKKDKEPVEKPVPKGKFNEK